MGAFDGAGDFLTRRRRGRGGTQSFSEEEEDQPREPVDSGEGEGRLIHVIRVGGKVTGWIG
jgi:hypothetical protein